MNLRERQVIKLGLSKEERVIEALERQYRNALRDIDDRIRILLADELTQSRVYQIQYQRALRGQVASILDKLHGDQYATIQQYLHDSYQDGYIGSMYSLHGQGIPLIVPLDQDAAVKAIVTDSKISEGLYESLGVDTKKLKRAISSEITRGIATNMPFADIVRNISNRTRAPLARAKTIVRTESHRINCQAAHDAALKAKENGADIVLQWDATTDKKTRSSHARLDGQIVEVGERFSNGLLYPGDPAGDAADVVNCRCVALTRARWALDEDELKTMKERAEYFGLDKTEEFDKFKEKYLKAAAEVPRNKPEKAPEPLKIQGKSGIINSVEMLQKASDDRSGFRFINDEHFDRLTIPARKNGATIIRGTEEVEAHLTALGASASAIGDVLLFRKNVCVCEVLEETRHFMQNLQGMNDDKGEPLRSILNEIDAKEYVIQNAEKYKVPRNEVELMETQLASYRRQLERYKDGDG